VTKPSCTFSGPIPDCIFFSAANCSSFSGGLLFPSLPLGVKTFFLMFSVLPQMLMLLSSFLRDFEIFLFLLLLVPFCFPVSGNAVRPFFSFSTPPAPCFFPLNRLIPSAHPRICVMFLSAFDLRHETCRSFTVSSHLSVSQPSPPLILLGILSFPRFFCTARSLLKGRSRR